MKKAGQKRLFSGVMIVTFLATSTLPCAATFINTTDIHSASAFQEASDGPYNSDQQFPFEEKEKEFEDKDEVDGKGNPFEVDLYFICDIETEYNLTDCLFMTVESFATTKNRSLFLSNHTLLI